MVIFYKKWKKYNEFQLEKNKMDLNNRKMTSSTLPRLKYIHFDVLKAWIFFISKIILNN